MIPWAAALWRKLRGADQPLRGAPPVRRLKTHSAASGYVYQYFYEGYRRTPTHDATDYVFSVSADRKTQFPVTVRLPDASLTAWTLTATEHYAIAKMALFQAFDEREQPAALRHLVLVRPADAAGILEQLGRA